MSEKTGLYLRGSRQTGMSVREQNVQAALAVANVVKTSLGPVGLDKMLVDDLGEVTITNDGATILKLLDVQHPAGKVLVNLAQLQDEEVGDGTTSVVVVAAQLLKAATQLVGHKIHPTTIIQGYRHAQREAVKFIKERLAIPSESLGKETLHNVAMTSMSSKIIGGEREFFANLAVEAVKAVKTTNKKGVAKYPVKAVNILKSHGGSARDSELILGYALNCTRASLAMPRRMENAKIAMIDFNLTKARMKMGVHLVVKDPTQLEGMRQRESDLAKEAVQRVIESGANVVMTTKGIDDLVQKYLVDAGIIGVRRVKREDLKRIAKATGGQIVMSLADLEGDESFDPAALGSASLVEERRVGDNHMIVISGTKNVRAASVLLRGANEYMLEEMERSLHDALCIVRRTLESKSVVPGGGAVEAALSIHLENFATTLGSREQLAIAEYANALLVIPKQLAVNAAKDATDLVAKLRAYHNTAQKDEERKALSNYGLDLVEGVVRDSVEAGVLEPAMSKIKSLQSATEAAITILRIDDMITLDAPYGDDAE